MTPIVNFSIIKDKILEKKKSLNPSDFKAFSDFIFGAYDGTRTHDLSLTKAVRYLLRHISILKFLSDFCCFLNDKICHFLSYQGSALPIELHQHIKFFRLIFRVKPYLTKAVRYLLRHISMLE